jgi:hypothetical protein
MPLVTNLHFNRADVMRLVNRIVKEFDFLENTFGQFVLLQLASKHEQRGRVSADSQLFFNNFSLYSDNMDLRSIK